MVFKIVFVSFICTLVQDGHAQIGMGPLNIKLVRAGHCPADEQVFSAEVVPRDDGSDGMKLKFDLPYPMDDKISYITHVDKLQNGQVQKDIFRNGGPNACENLHKYLGNFYKNIVVAMNMGTNCPVPAGSYSVDNLKFDQNDLGMKTFLYGRFILNTEFMREGKKILCFTLEFTNSRPGESV